MVSLSNPPAFVWSIFDPHPAKCARMYIFKLAVRSESSPAHTPTMIHRIVFVATPEQLDACFIDIASNNASKVAIDLEGIDLCRNGRISILQLIAEGSDTIWLIDVTTIGRAAFEHQDTDGRSLKSILESRDITKVFCLFDI